MVHSVDWMHRARVYVGSHPLILYLTAFGLVVGGAIFPQLQLYAETTIPPANWSGVFQYPYSNRSAVPSGSVNTTFFQVSETNPEPLTLNLSSSSWNASVAFVTIYGGATGLQILARDAGAYSGSPLRLNVTTLSILFINSQNLSYVRARQCDFQIRANGFPSPMRVSLVPMQGVYPDLVLNATGSSDLHTVVEYTPRTPQADFEFRASGVSLTDNAGNRTNLTGTATVDVSSYSAGYLGLTESGQRFLLYPGADATFQTPAVQLRSLYGYLTDGAGHGGNLIDAAVDFGTPVSFELQATIPINPSGNTATLDAIATGAEVRVLSGGSSFVSNGITVEPASVRDLGLAVGGALTFLGGLAAGIATRVRVGGGLD